MIQNAGRLTQKCHAHLTHSIRKPIVWIFLCIPLLILSNQAYSLKNNESGPSSSKNTTNIYGMLKTVHGAQAVKVDNIALNGSVGIFDTYEIPKELTKTIVPNNVSDEDSTTIANEEIPLPIADPSAELGIIKFDLKTMVDAKISVPTHRRIWTFLRKGHRTPKKYLEVTITNNQTKTVCLMDANTKISADLRTHDESIETETVLLSGLEHLEINGVCTRDHSGKCPVPLSFKKRRGLVKSNQ